jgi:hypothetical protein
MIAVLPAGNRGTRDAARLIRNEILRAIKREAERQPP